MNSQLDYSAYHYTREQRLAVAKDLLNRVKSPALVAHMAAIVAELERIG